MQKAGAKAPRAELPVQRGAGGGGKAPFYAMPGDLAHSQACLFSCSVSV